MTLLIFGFWKICFKKKPESFRESGQVLSSGPVVEPGMNLKTHFIALFKGKIEVHRIEDQIKLYEFLSDILKESIEDQLLKIIKIYATLLK
ncbi:hypothetical protein BpHYR1_036797 [Brachionus plicatilis]|uniref:Uncharacterized protein n=1 Tax=Brachionus plicatilis TaxID=10195 RepID=A0A3M7RYX0_BRAPC|nr:hypothetical protein BpHYR1_036797 [Brachionus plicatilis]